MLIIVIVIFSIIIGVSYLLFLPFKRRSGSFKLFGGIAIATMWIAVFLYLGHFFVSEYYGHTIVNDVCFRNSPSTKSKVLVKLPYGTRLKLIEMCSEWWKARLRNGEVGYLPQSALKVFKSYNWFWQPMFHLVIFLAGLVLYTWLLLTGRSRDKEGGNIPDEKINVWLMSEEDFLACIDNPKKRVFIAGQDGVICLRCTKIALLGPCFNCDSQTYYIGRNRYGEVGFFCIRCYQGFTSHTCECGCINPITCKTVGSLRRNSKCFIVSAAYENIETPEVVYLSTLRDEVLSKTIVGRFFIRVYYIVSPFLAKTVSKSRLLRIIVRWMISFFFSRSARNVNFNARRR